MYKKLFITFLLIFNINQSFSAGSGGNNKQDLGKDFNEALTLINKQSYQKAITKLKKLINKSSNSFSKADVLNELGFAFRKTGDTDKSMEYYVKALKKDPAHLGALEYQGELFVDLGMKNNALNNLEMIKNIEGESGSYYQELNFYIQNN